MKYLLILLLFSIKTYGLGLLSIRLPIANNFNNDLLEISLFIKEPILPKLGLSIQSFSMYQINTYMMSDLYILKNVTDDIEMGIGGSIQKDYYFNNPSLSKAQFIINLKVWK